MRERPVEETDGLIERGSKRELETEMKRNEVRQRESREWRGEKVSGRREEGECMGFEGGWQMKYLSHFCWNHNKKRSKERSRGILHTQLCYTFKVFL